MGLGGGRTAEQQICGGDVVFGRLSLLDRRKKVSINNQQ
jgi:hypothetical protein